MHQLKNLVVFGAIIGTIGGVISSLTLYALMTPIVENLEPNHPIILYVGNGAVVGAITGCIIALFVKVMSKKSQE